MMNRIYEILISLAVIVAVTWLGDRFPSLSGIVATMPLTIPLTLIIVYRNTGGNPEATAEFAQAAIVGIVATAAFVVASWFALQRRWPIGLIVGTGYAGWGLVLLLWRLVERIWSRG